MPEVCCPHWAFIIAINTMHNCLADDIKEPYRLFVDKQVIEIMESSSNISEITKEHKGQLLNILVLDVIINNKRSPLMIAVQKTTASLAQCFMGEVRRIKYPTFS